MCSTINAVSARPGPISTGRAPPNFFGAPASGPRLLNVPLSVWRSLMLSSLKYRLTSGHPDRWLWHLMSYGYARGAADFWLRHGAYQARGRASGPVAAEAGGA